MRRPRGPPMLRHDEIPPLALDNPAAERCVKSAFGSLRDRASSSPATPPAGDLWDGSYEGTGECGPKAASSPRVCTSSRNTETNGKGGRRFRRSKVWRDGLLRRQTSPRMPIVPGSASLSARRIRVMATSSSTAKTTPATAAHRRVRRVGAVRAGVVTALNVSRAFPSCVGPTPRQFGPLRHRWPRPVRCGTHAGEETDEAIRTRPRRRHDRHRRSPYAGA